MPVDENLTGEQTGVAEVEAAAQQQTGVNEAGAAVQPSSAAEIEAFKAKAEDEVRKRRAAELEREQLRQQLALASQQQPQQPQDMFARQGLSDDDFLTVGQQRQFFSEQAQQYMQAIQFQNFVSQNPDFNQTVGIAYSNGQVQCAQPLRDFINENPSYTGLEYLATSNVNWARTAYELVKKHQKVKELEAKVNSFSEHQKLIDEQTVPLSPASVGGGGAAITTDLSDAQVEELDRKIKAGEFG